MPFNQQSTNGNVRDTTGRDNYIQLNTSPSTVPPTSPGTLYWNSEYGTLNIQPDITNSLLQVGQEQWLRVVNKTGSDVSDGAVVYISGAQGQRPKIGLADADAENQSYIIGLVTADILNNQEGFVTISGLVNDIDTTGTPVGEVWADGDPLWLSSTAGKLTKNKLAAPKHSNFVGICVYAHAVHGKIYVSPQLGSELDELHDVKITSIADKQLLVRDQSAGYWKNTSNVTLDDATPAIATNTNDLIIDCGTEKTVVLSSLVWDDVYPSSVTIGSGANAPSFTAYNGNLRAYEFLGTGATAKELNMGFQFNHSIYIGAAVTIHPHLHLYIPNDVTGGVIKFYCEYTWTEIGSTGSVATTTVSGTVTRAAGAGIANNAILDFNSSAITDSKGISSVFMCRIYRDPADAADTFGSSVWLKSADIHYPKDTVGSRQEFIK